mmetsp:Transcript_30101/g.78035  ORF Transcript_30101/g.78035 Transcript_30101/m.78035 type:complete len:438 (-) Transcript_30101:319-1632(-)
MQQPPEASITPILSQKLTLILYGHCFLQGFHQALFFPTLAYSVDEVLHKNAVWASFAFFIFLVFGLLSMAVMSTMLDVSSPRTLLIFSYAVRVFSGLIYLPVGLLTRLYGDEVGMAITLAFRAITGSGQYAVALAFAYIGVRCAKADRPLKIAVSTTCLSFGLVVGPMIGAWLVSLAGGDVLLGAGRAGGVLSLTSLLGIVIIHLFFDDFALLSANKAATQNIEPATKHFLAICGLSMFFAYAGILALEAILALVLFHEFGMAPDDSWPIWLLQAFTQMFGALLYIKLQSAIGVKPTMVTLFGFTIVGGALCYNWFDLHAPIPLGLMVVGLTGKIVGMFGSINLLNAHVSQRMPDYMQGPAAATVQITSMLGRAVGPIFTGWIFDIGRTAAPNTYLADSLAMLTQYMYVVTSCLIVIAAWDFVLDSKLLNTSFTGMV